MNSERKNNSNQNTQTLGDIIKQKPILLYSILISILLLIIFTFYMIEKLIFIILTLLTFTRIISIPIQILLHILFVRYIVIQIAFAGQNFFISKSIYKNIGKMQSDHILKEIKSLHDLLSIFNDIRGLAISISQLNDIKKQIETIQNLSNYSLDIFSRMKSRFNSLTIDQQLFYNNILSLNESINNGNLSNFINNIINVIKKYGHESLADVPDEEKNKIIAELSNRNLNLQRILMLCHTIMEQIVDYIGDIYPCFNLRRLRNYFYNRLFASVEQLHCELSIYFNFEEKHLITKDKCKLEYIIVRKEVNSPEKKLMIICGPNGVPIQLFARNFKFDKYLDLNMDVLFWNYRGYGFSEGHPSYTNLRNDVLELFDEVKKNTNYERFAVHGISIGGIPCCHLAANRSEIEVMICDRNFGRLDNIVQSFPYGKYLFFLYKFLFFQSSDNVENYLNVKCHKIVLNDPNDNIVLETCSLKTLISKELVEKYFDCKKGDTSSENNINLFSSHNNELESLSNKNNKNNNPNNSLSFLDDKITIANYNNSKGSKTLIKKTVLDKIFNSVEDKNKFINALIHVSKIIAGEKLETNSGGNCFTKLFNRIKSKTVQYSNLKEEELQNTSGIFDFVKTNIGDIFESLESGGDTFYSLINIEREYTKGVFIDNFFNNMFIWGSKFNNSNYQTEDFHSTKNIKYIFVEFMKFFEEFWSSQEIISYKELPLVKEIEIIYKYFIQIQNSLNYVGFNVKNEFIKLINEESSDENKNDLDYEQCLKKINGGYLVPLTCGHNGALSFEENELFQKYLMKSSFFNDKINIIDSKEDNDDVNTSPALSSSNLI